MTFARSIWFRKIYIASYKLQQDFFLKTAESSVGTLLPCDFAISFPCGCRGSMGKEPQNETAPVSEFRQKMPAFENRGRIPVENRVFRRPESEFSDLREVVPFRSFLHGNSNGTASLLQFAADDVLIVRVAETFHYRFLKSQS